MRRQDKEEVLPAKYIITSKCAGKEHKIFIKNGAICLLGHPGFSLRTLINEWNLRDKKSRTPRGCVLFAMMVLGEGTQSMGTLTPNDFEKRTRRSSPQRKLFDGGIDVTAASKFFREAVVRRAAHRSSRQYIDDYPYPFYKMPSHRVARIYSRIRREQDQKLERVHVGLKQRGFQPLATWELPSYRR